MATSQPTTATIGNTPKTKKSSAWKQSVNKPKTHWTALKAVNMPHTQRARQKKIG